jgi:hypothetical protein
MAAILGRTRKGHSRAFLARVVVLILVIKVEAPAVAAVLVVEVAVVAMVESLY